MGEKLSSFFDFENKFFDKSLPVIEDNGKVKLVNKRYANFFLLFLTFFIVLLGVVTGWYASIWDNKKDFKDFNVNTLKESNIVNFENEAGIIDASKFSTSAQGLLVEGGINGEGTHHLQRPGGVSQNVYLTSTVIDLQTFVGKNVTVWGDTISGMNAGWLIDVGKIKVND
ncbi:MAG: hypothetical protein N2558_00865 [Patescibacteria group bacterium]|nr:hypothetical protein [Patescibacteria group bacterium]